MKRSGQRGMHIAAAAVIVAVAFAALVSYSGDVAVARADVRHAEELDTAALAHLHVYASMRSVGDLFPGHR
jgi:hypothetical protein